MYILKKHLGVILAYVILVVLLASSDCAAENKTLVFVGNDSYPPISYQEGGKAKGLAIDIVRALGQRMGRQIDIRLMEWKVAQAMVAQGKADALCQLSITEARKQIYDFSDQAHDLRFSIFVRTGKQGINDLSDLRGLQVAVIAASVQHQLAMADSQIKFTLTANDLQGFQLLKDGKVEAVLADLWTGSYVLAEKGITGIQASGEPFAHLASAISVKKGNTALLAAINDGLRSLQADGTIERINEKWRPQEIIVQTREQAMRKTYFVLIGILGLLLVVGAFWLITLKREISERKRVEEQLQATKIQLANALEIAHLGHWEYDVANDIFTFNDQFYKIFRTTADQCGGYTMHSTEYAHRFVHPDEMYMVGEETRKAIETTDPHFSRQIEHRMLYADGSVGYLSVRFFIVKDSHGKTVKTYGVNQDITDHKRAEEEKQSFVERLQRSEKMEALGQLAGGVAHDLNNVLGILTGYSELLLEEIPEESQSRIYVDKIMQSTKKGAAIIEDLLTLARRSVVIADVINLNRVVADYIQTPVFEKVKDYHPRVTFRIECDEDLLNIKGSPVHLEKTVMNLVSNAAEAITEVGEVTVRTESRHLDKPILGYDEVKEGDYAVLIVSDNGMGIPAENRTKIFEPFYTKKKMGRSGTGLGLAIVWGTVKDHNGYIDIRTEVGEGTTFTLYFPVTREEMIAPQQKEPLEQYKAHGESVLVVDDVQEQREVATTLLTQMGYSVNAVSSGEDAVEYLKSNKADILVLDMIMEPGIDGLDTYKQVIKINPQQKAIIVSGFSETERSKEAQQLGAGPYIKKPYLKEKIGVAIRDELNR